MKKNKKKNTIVDKSYYAGESNKSIVARISKTQKLLEEFGLRVYAFDPGVSCFACFVKGNTYEGISDISFNKDEWEWLKPLLEELLEYRKGKK